MLMMTLFGCENIHKYMYLVYEKKA
jgi:hypothetical protein